ncbi:hypothetical protein VNO78_10405 [Psophocarpus tetragonolobus]|uniref:Uncharacterized protein n=1 Tax=Psophocarpus tetragonolobus TaxID=3891 RepID=A0AAN9SKJ1_PSOTE
MSSSSGGALVGLQATFIHVVEDVTEAGANPLLEGGWSLSSEGNIEVPKGVLTLSHSLFSVVVMVGVPLVVVATPAVEAGRSLSPTDRGGSSEALLSYFVPWIFLYVCGNVLCVQVPPPLAVVKWFIIATKRVAQLDHCSMTPEVRLFGMSSFLLLML